MLCNYKFLSFDLTLECFQIKNGIADGAPKKNHLHIRLLGRWWLGQGEGGGGGEKSPKTFSGEESQINNCYEKIGASGLWKRENPILIYSCEKNSGSQ